MPAELSSSWARAACRLSALAAFAADCATHRALILRRRVTFVTHELTPERRALLKEGVIDAIIDQNPDLEIATAVGLIARHFGRRDDAPPVTGITPLTIYLRENA